MKLKIIIFVLGTLFGSGLTYFGLNYLAYDEMYHQSLISSSVLVRASAEMHVKGEDEKTRELLSLFLENNIKDLAVELGTSLYEQTNKSMQYEAENSKKIIDKLSNLKANKTFNQ